ncbi:hypothetical protein F5Y04DRAFT_280415 [Hypomontagnella monticulosa]|nr:hypothetical protein F5Y04DRAFT_280415 [Hypomontagnella monticulosa]
MADPTMWHPLLRPVSVILTALWILKRLFTPRSDREMDQIYYGIAYHGYRIQCRLLGVPPMYIRLFDPPSEPRNMISQGEWFCSLNTMFFGITWLLSTFVRRSSCWFDLCFWVAAPFETVSFVVMLFLVWIHAFYQGRPIPENEGGEHWRD